MQLCLVQSIVTIDVREDRKAIGVSGQGLAIS
jgi:hypothetical protein